MITIAFLQGRFVLRCDDKRIDLQPMQIRVLLALYCAGGRVETSQLVNLLWHIPTSGNRDTLRTHIKRIRDKVADAGGTPDEFIVTTPIGDGQYAYELAGDVRFDANEFSVLASGGYTALAVREYRQASGQLGAALALWGTVTTKDQLLPEAAAYPFALQTRDKLWQARKDAGIGKAEADTNIGLHRLAAADLARMAHHWPQDREIAEHRVIALYRCGRSEEASEVCRLAIRAAREVGIDDGSLRKLQQALLTETLPPPPRDTVAV
jgi:DNA-binding SARP family transcriptional activator